MFVGLNIKFTNKIHPMDGHKGLGTIHSINKEGPGAKSSLALGDRVLMLLGKIIHTKEELYAVIREKKEKIMKALIPKKFYEVPLIIERPCMFARTNARLRAENYIREQSGMKCKAAKTVAFEFTCDQCHDCIKFFVVAKTSPAPKVSKSSGSGSLSATCAGSDSSIRSQQPAKKQNECSFSDIIERDSPGGKEGILIDLSM